jgi:hypothetical protein
MKTAGLLIDADQLLSAAARLKQPWPGDFHRFIARVGSLRRIKWC